MEKTLSTKQYIQRYILLKISSGDWETTKKIPSEGTLAIRFSCSRLTVRTILQNFVYSGLLMSVKGKGYYVTSMGGKGSFLFTNCEFQTHRQVVKQLNNSEIEFKEKWIQELDYKFDDLNLKRKRYFEKFYYDKCGEKLIYEISILNNEEVILCDDIEIKKSLVEYLIWQGIMLSLLNSTLIIESDPKYQKIAQELGWKDEYPIILSILTTPKNWIEISLKIVARKVFKFKRSYKIIM